MTIVPSDHGRNGPESDSGEPNNNHSVSIDHFHYTENDIKALAEMADRHPELAVKLLHNRHKEMVITANSERLGMVMATILGAVLIGGTSWTLIGLGWWQSIMFVAALLGISHVLRTVLKGEFSDTSWFARILTKTPKDDKN